MGLTKQTKLFDSPVLSSINFSVELKPMMMSVLPKTYIEIERCFYCGIHAFYKVLTYTYMDIYPDELSSNKDFIKNLALCDSN